MSDAPETPLPAFGADFWYTCHWHRCRYSLVCYIWRNNSKNREQSHYWLLDNTLGLCEPSNLLYSNTRHDHKYDSTARYEIMRDTLRTTRASPVTTRTHAHNTPANIVTDKNGIDKRCQTHQTSTSTRLQGAATWRMSRHGHRAIARLFWKFYDDRCNRFVV